MRMPTARRIAGWIGTAMFGIAVSFAPAYLNGRSPSLLWMIVSSIVIAICCSVFWFFTKDSASDVSNIVPANTIANNPVNTFNPVVNVNPTFTPILVNGERVDAQPNEQKNAEKQRNDMEAPKQLRLRVDGIGIVRLRYDPDEGQWVCGNENDEEGLIIWIKNCEAPIGQPNYVAEKLKAILQFRSETAYRTTVARAYWLKAFLSQINLEAGDRRAIIVGISDGDVWKTYENRMVVEKFTHFGTINSYIELQGPTLVPKDEYICFSVTLLEGRNQHSVFKCTFKIDFRTGSWHAKQIENLEL